MLTVQECYDTLLYEGVDAPAISRCSLSKITRQLNSLISWFTDNRFFRKLGACNKKVVTLLQKWPLSPESISHVLPWLLLVEHASEGTAAANVTKVAAGS